MTSPSWYLMRFVPSAARSRKTHAIVARSTNFSCTRGSRQKCRRQTTCRCRAVHCRLLPTRRAGPPVKCCWTSCFASQAARRRSSGQLPSHCHRIINTLTTHPHHLLRPMGNHRAICKHTPWRDLRNRTSAAELLRSFAQPFDDCAFVAIDRA